MNPSTSLSLLSCAMVSSNVSSVTSSSKRMRVDLNPHCSQALTLWATYVSLPPSWPTSMAAKWGRFSPRATISATSVAISRLMSSAIFFPSMSCISVEGFCLTVAQVAHHLHGILHCCSHLHDFAHFFELLNHAIYVGNVCSRAFGYALATACVDELWVATFFFCH